MNKNGHAADVSEKAKRQMFQTLRLFPALRLFKSRVSINFSTRVALHRIELINKTLVNDDFSDF